MGTVMAIIILFLYKKQVTCIFLRYSPEQMSVRVVDKVIKLLMSFSVIYICFVWLKKVLSAV